MSAHQAEIVHADSDRGPIDFNELWRSCNRSDHGSNTLGWDLFALLGDPIKPLFEQRDSRAILDSARLGVCTASWRGYKVEWEIKDEQLYLTALDLNPCGQQPDQFPLYEIAQQEAPVFASWYSGDLLIFEGGEPQCFLRQGYVRVPALRT